MLFLEMKFFSFPKKVLDQVHFKKIYNDWIRPTLVIFLTFFEKKYNNWIKCKLSKSRIKWTGLLSPVHPNYNRSFLIWSKFQGLAQKLKDQPFAAAAKDFKSGIPFKKSFLDFWLFLDPASFMSAFFSRFEINVWPNFST